MHYFFKRQVALIWIAMLGVLFSALAPTISHAMAATQQSALTMEICTADRSLSGFKSPDTAQVAAHKAPSGIDLHSFEHCPYCATQGSMLMLPPGARAVFALPSLTATWPDLFYQSSTPLFSWTPCNPRGPPALA
ncbi:DUF2946 domain-containing protein [Massilia sp. S19_KUP03_FR1]|uniref:DUF2946 domain-containing protein n=1 Tax=Massilia sp. S19_KUP03_FR1 TaxID=3025503 RepID=UPI002FCD7DDF